MKFEPTWLYVKECSHCGLLYFGKTTHDPMTYRGSGTYWTRHLDKHSAKALTRKVQLYTNARKIKTAALRFSAKHDVANSELWANLRDEDGIGAGGAHSHRMRSRMRKLKTGSFRWYTNCVENRAVQTGDPIPMGFKPGRVMGPHSEATKRMISEQRTGAVFSPAHRKALSAAAKGQPKSAEHVAKMAASKRGLRWFNDGEQSYQLDPTDPKTKRLAKGRVKTGKSWYTDGVQSFLLLPTDLKTKRLQPGRVYG